MLSSPGIGSGLDVRGMVERLMQLERRPLLELNRREAHLQSQVSAYGELGGVLGKLRDAAEALADPALFDRYSADSSAPEVLTASPGPGASEGGFSVEVKRVAEQHRLASGTAFADRDATAVAAAGATMRIAVGGAELTVDIGDKTLEQVRDAINTAADNPGVFAFLLADDAGHRLVLAAEDPGADGFMTVTYGGADPFAFASLNADRDTDGSVTANDLNAELLLEGQFTVTSGTNVVTGALEGLTFTLHAPGSALVTVTRDRSAVRAAVESFVGAYNEVIKVMNRLRETALASDRAALLAVESQLRSALNRGSAGGAIGSFAEIGVSSTGDGTLQVDDEMLDAALADPDALAELLAAEGVGLAVAFAASAERMLAEGGLVDGRQDGLTERIERIDRQRQALERRLEGVEQRLLEQFSALDGLVADLNETGDFLFRQIDLLTNIGAGRNR